MQLLLSVDRCCESAVMPERICIHCRTDWMRQPSIGDHMGTWNVTVYRDGASKHLGTVCGDGEDDARCAALHKFGISEEEADEGTLRARIYPVDEFEVSPA